MKSKRVDAPLVPLAIALAAMLSIGAAVVWHQWLFWLVTVLLLICLGLYLNASWRGKEQIIDETITYLHLSSDAQVLDLGTDQGNVLVKLAKRLTIPGHATGVEVGRKSAQSHNSLARAKDSLQAAAMADRASVQAADILNLPFKDHQFDGILIWMTLHQVKPTINRARAVQEAARTLKSDGTLAIIDFRHFDEYQKILARLGFHDITVHQCGVNGWWGVPWLSTKILFAFFGMVMSQLTYFAAVKYSNAPTATVIQYLAPVIIIGYTAAAQKMMPRRIDVVSIIVALVGTFLLVTNGNLNHLALSPQACFWALLAALANAISTMAPGRLFARYGTLNVTAWSMLICGICFIPLYFIMPMPALRPLDVALIGWIVIGGTLLAYTLYLASVQYIDPSTTGMLGAFEPLVATILAVALLHTQFGPVNILASCLIILATFLQMMPLQIFSHRRSLN